METSHLTSVRPLSGAHWVDHLARHAFARPDEGALTFGPTTVSWSRLHERVARLADGLAARGVTAGSRVAILMTNRLEVVESTFAANALGAIAVPLNFRLAPAEVAYILADSDPAVIVTEQALAALVREAGVDVPVVVVGGDTADTTDRSEEYEQVLGARTSLPDVVIDERDTALIMYTSGTTGRPKGAMLTHLNLLMSAISMIRTHRLVHDDDVYMIDVPLFHIGGIGMLPAPLLNGTRTVIRPTAGFDAGSSLEVIASERVTATFLVPAQWQALCDHPDASRLTRTLRTASWGGAPAPAALLQRMHEVFGDVEIVAVFGQTETSPPSASMPGPDAERKVGSVGRAVPLVAARIVDDRMRDVADGEVGELVYRGPVVTTGYWNDQERTDEAFAGGWFHSGDLARRDADGFLHIVDRLKDMIISGGENIYCAEVENALAGHPGVADVAVIGAPDERWGETPVAVVVATDPADPPTIEQLRTWAESRLASYKRPTRLAVVDALPRNAGGKVLKDVLRAAYGGGR